MGAKMNKAPRYVSLVGFGLIILWQVFGDVIRYWGEKGFDPQNFLSGDVGIKFLIIICCTTGIAFTLELSSAIIVFKEEPLNRIEDSSANIKSIAEKYHRKINVSLFLAAGTDVSYYSALSKLAAGKIGELRVLLYKPVISEQQIYPHTTDETKHAVEECCNEICKLKELVTSNQVSKIIIHTFAFPPAFHFCLIENRIAQWGVYENIVLSPGRRCLSTYSISGRSESGLSIYEDFKVTFENVFSNYSAKVYDSSDS